MIFFMILQRFQRVLENIDPRYYHKVSADTKHSKDSIDIRSYHSEIPNYPDPISPVYTENPEDSMSFKPIQIVCNF